MSLENSSSVPNLLQAMGIKRVEHTRHDGKILPQFHVVYMSPNGKLYFLDERSSRRRYLSHRQANQCMQGNAPYQLQGECKFKKDGQ